MGIADQFFHSNLIRLEKQITEKMQRLKHMVIWIEYMILKIEHKAQEKKLLILQTSRRY